MDEILEGIMDVIVEIDENEGEKVKWGRAARGAKERERKD